jgi:segregation and condensation protein B
VRAALDEMIAAYASEDRGVEIRAVAGGYKFYTKPQHHEVVRRFIKSLRPPLRLTMPALETLAVIAYKQPVTAPEIAEIRGVSSSSGVLQTLIERKLIKTVGRKPVVGRPFMYGTTREFLDRFGLNDIADLPKVEELSDALGFELPAGLAEPTVTTSPLPFDSADEVPQPEPAEDETTVH